MIVNYCSSTTLEYNYFEYRNTNGTVHGEAVSINYSNEYIDPDSSANWVIRYNTFKDATGTGFIVIKDSVQKGFKVYGNVFYTTARTTYYLTNGIITSSSSGTTSDCLVYNNTVYNCGGISGAALTFTQYAYSPTGNITKNNLVYGCGAVKLTGTQEADYNAAESAGTGWDGANNVTITGGSPFTDVGSYNFHIDETNGSELIGAGVNLGAPYNLDIDGNTRPAEGGWTIGAYGGTGAAVDTTHSVTLTSPNGGEVWGIGKSHNITFTGNSYVDSIIVLVSTNNGSSYVAQDTLLTTVGSFAWTIPNEASVQCFVIIQDKTDNAVADTSATVFTIAVPLHVTAPDGAEVWRPGDTENITWNAADVPFVKIEYSLDGGSAWWTIVDEGTAAAGTLAWIIPNINSTNCKVRITDTSDGSITDASDAVFTIQPVTAGTNSAINDINALLRGSE